MDSKIKCGRCQSEFALQTVLGKVQPAKCPLCGYSAQDVRESKNESKQVLKD